MVMWCKGCGAFLGLREPLHDWAEDKFAICVDCAKKEHDLAELCPQVLVKTPTQTEKGEGQ